MEIEINVICECGEKEKLHLKRYGQSSKDELYFDGAFNKSRSFVKFITFLDGKGITIECNSCSRKQGILMS